MQPQTNINLTGPVSLTFLPDHLMYLLDLLAEQPYKKANPVISMLVDQLQGIERLKAQAAAGNGSAASKDKAGDGAAAN